MSSKKKLQQDAAYEQRKEFIKVYTEFDRWLGELNFKSKPSNTPDDYFYSFYNNYIKAMYAVEFYRNDFLNISLRFLRDDQVHKFALVGACETTYTIDEFKAIIMKYVTGSLSTIKLNLSKYDHVCV